MPPHISELTNRDYCYILEVNHQFWDDLPDAVKHLLIYHELLHIPEGGCDSSSKTYKKTLPHDTKDFTKVLSMASGVEEEQLNWCSPTAEISDILSGVKKIKKEETEALQGMDEVEGEQDGDG